jgi:hypothetical protein
MPGYESPMLSEVGDFTTFTLGYIGVYRDHPANWTYHG